MKINICQLLHQALILMLFSFSSFSQEDIPSPKIDHKEEWFSDGISIVPCLVVLIDPDQNTPVAKAIVRINTTSQNGTHNEILQENHLKTAKTDALGVAVVHIPMTFTSSSKSKTKRYSGEIDLTILVEGKVVTNISKDIVAKIHSEFSVLKVEIKNEAPKKGRP